ncbi:MAG: tetratricopeptide repeat protein [Planctomycetaceae bacterium]|nr:tetratricopeptide repeat protein [Planctomycetaceae bacterium]
MSFCFAADSGREPLPLHRQAVQKAREKQYQESENLFRQAVAADSKNSVLLCDFAKMYADQNRLSEAETILKNAVLIEPNNRRVLFNLGRTAAMQNDRQMEGLRYLKLALGEADAYRELAKICRTQGNTEQAEFAEQQAKTAPQQRIEMDSPLVPMDEKTKKELTDQIRLELLRLETKEIAAEQDKSAVRPIQTAPEFQPEASVKLTLLPKAEESVASKAVVKRIPPENKPPVPFAALTDIAVIKNAPEYSAIGKDASPPIHITPNKIDKGGTGALVKIRQGKVPPPPFRDESKTTPPSATPQGFEKISDYHFASAQAPQVLKFGIASDEPVKEELKKPEKPVSKEDRLTAANVFQPPTVLNFGPAPAVVPESIQIAKKETAKNEVRSLPQIAAPVVVKPAELPVVKPAEPVMVANEKPKFAAPLILEPVVVEPAEPVMAASEKPKFAAPLILEQPVIEKLPEKQPAADELAAVAKAVKEPAPVFMEPKLTKIEPPKEKEPDAAVVVSPAAEIKPAETPEKTKDFELTRLKKAEVFDVSAADIQAEFFGKVAGKLPSETLLLDNIPLKTEKPVPAPVPIKEPEDEAAGFATTRKGSKYTDSAGLFSPRNNLTDNPIFAADSETAGDAGFARSGQFTKKQK